MSLRFAIRDDDICYHTNSEELQSIYHEINKICPISFSCIPFVGGFDVKSFTSEKWAQFDEQWLEWQTEEIFPIGQNKELISLLKSWCGEGKATIMLHGINHDLFEFEQNRDFSIEIKRQDFILNNCFQEKLMFFHLLIIQLNHCHALV